MILMPEELTAENGAKYALIGKFHETFEHECPECEGCGMGAACPHAQGESRCKNCDGAGTIFERVPVEWTTIKEIYKHAVALLGKSQDAAIAEAVAAEQRRKDAEGQEPAGKVIATFESGQFMVNPHPQTNRVKTGEYVYTRPANVAALEARVKELEVERDRYRKCMADCVELLGRTKPGTLARIWLQDCLDTAHAALTREGGV